jgi:hypothetical protein
MGKILSKYFSKEDIQFTSKHMKRLLLIISETEVKVYNERYCLYTRVSIILKRRTITNAGKDVEKWAS